ncbi:hypothetical protein K8P10_000743 [Leucobacter sp. Psy1]|uniref:DsbA family protein n=1 Tax=Leucobacter sp. Psy1 TaxID=2875729 RepID=UPI001CD1C5DC|nr:thioredoxin domain-containing protein [Leucobacter sp. Psy1]UBH05232.1 hypothetical protein K8P10_000743 [Leucobacter sp. Psy1]
MTDPTPQDPHAHYTPVDRSVPQPGQGGSSKKVTIWTVAAILALAFTAFCVFLVMSRLDDQSSEAGGVEWPANMRTGGILFESGTGGLAPVLSEAPEEGAVPEPVATDRASGPLDIQLYVDYRCPACAAFEAENAALLEAAVTSGEATLELRPMTFLDDDTQYSSRAAGAVACVVDAQPELAWDAHTALLDSRVQPGHEAPGLENDEIVAVIERATGGLDGATRSCIEDERFAPFAQALNAWASSTAVPEADADDVTVAHTPFVVAGGAVYEGDASDGAAFAAFLAEQGLQVTQ